MIAWQNEQLLTLNQAADRLSTAGGVVTPETVRRWALTGVRGRRLETVLLGGRRITSVEAIQRFVDVEQPKDAPSSEPRRRAAATRAHKDATAALKAMGIA